MLDEPRGWTLQVSLGTNFVLLSELFFDWMKIVIYSFTGLMSGNIIALEEGLVLLAFSQPCFTFSQAIL